MEMYKRFRRMEDNETTRFSGLFVTRHKDNDCGGWSIKEKEDSVVWLYISDDGSYSEYMFPITAKYDPDSPPIHERERESYPEDGVSTPPNHKFVWSKGVYRR